MRFQSLVTRAKQKNKKDKNDSWKKCALSYYSIYEQFSNELLRFFFFFLTFNLLTFDYHKNLSSIKMKLIQNYIICTNMILRIII